MIKISINNDKRRDLNDWLTHASSPAPAWLGALPSTCVYLLFTKNNNVQQCCDGNGILVIPSNGYSFKVGKNLQGPEGAVRVNYLQGPVRPCGSANKVFNEVIQYIIVFDPLSFNKTPNELKRIVKRKVQDLVNNFFTPIRTNSRDWFPFTEVDEEQLLVDMELLFEMFERWSV